MLSEMERSVTVDDVPARVKSPAVASLFAIGSENCTNAVSPAAFVEADRATGGMATLFVTAMFAVSFKALPSASTISLNGSDR